MRSEMSLFSNKESEESFSVFESISCGCAKAVTHVAEPYEQCME